MAIGVLTVQAAKEHVLCYPEVPSGQRNREQGKGRCAGGSTAEEAQNWKYNFIVFCSCHKSILMSQKKMVARALQVKNVKQGLNFVCHK